MNKKQYIFPSLTVVEIEVQDVLQGIVSGGYDEGGDNGGYGGSNEEEGMAAQRNGGFFDWN